MTTTATRCFTCMAEISGPTCPTCGATAGSIVDNTLYLPAGITLNNRYLIGKTIGFGGFGVVYLAWDTSLDVRVAVKEFLPKDMAGRSGDHLSLIPYSGGGAGDLEFGIKKFLEEAKALARFQDHPGIVTVHESFRANNTAYMVMQYLDGMTLKEYLKRQPDGRLPAATAVKTMIPIMDALREVHKAGFVHRDISPDNIFITRQSQVKLLDFGAARYALGEHSKSLTSILKHGYAPVEQYSSKGNQGPWTDVYAVSATLYRCITGETPADAMERVQEESLQAPGALGVALPPAFEAALLKGLALRAVERFENIEQLQSALLAVTSVKVPVAPPQPPLPAPATELSEEPPPIFEPYPIPKEQPTPWFGRIGVALGVVLLLSVLWLVVGVPVRAKFLQSRAEAPAPAPASPPAPVDTPRPVESALPTGSSPEIEMVKVAGGCFQMGDTFGDGSGDENPVHEVCVSDFSIGKYEVTQGQWQAVMGNNPSNFSSCGDDCPVENVSWDDVQEFIRKLNERRGGSVTRPYRLPTESEWEYAARSGGKQEKFSGGDKIDAVAWYASNSGNGTHPVGRKLANGLGLYDMSGNVWEWVNDWYDSGYYGKSPRDNPQGPTTGSGRVCRGGGWDYVPRNVRAAYRNDFDPGFRDNILGFRLVAPVQ